MTACVLHSLMLHAAKGQQTSTGAIAGGVAAGAALLFSIPAIAYAWWRRRRPLDAFFDVAGNC